MKYLGIDFGLRRIGLAISEGQLASPLKILEINSIPDAIEKVSRFIQKNDFDKIIVGFPEGKMQKNVIGFVSALQKKGFKVETESETLTSKQALQSMIQQGVGQKKRRHEDAYSAAEILQNYLDKL